MSTCAENRISLTLPDPDSTARLGRYLAGILRPGDCLLLSGEIGAGKSHLARSLIQTAMPLWGAPIEDVPSPTYTLAQVYETPQGEIWHVDLYRLSDPRETDELGLTDALDTALCLIEWPDRLGADCPKDALTVALTPDGESRRATLSAAAPRWQPILAHLTGGAP